MRRRAIGLLALLPILLWLGTAVARLSYPYELEWMEGGSLQHVQRVLAGEPLYVAPSPDWVPYIYPPLYFEVAALAARALGPTFLALRLVSFLSTLVALAALARLAWRETGRWELGLAAAGLFAAAYRPTGFWFEVARVDMLSLALVLAGAVILREARGWAAHAGGGAMLGLAVLAKQTALAPSLAVLAWAVLFRRPRGGAAALAALAVAGGASAWWDASSRGWYGFYVWQVPRRHPGGSIPFWSPLVSDLLPSAPVLLALGLGLALLGLRRVRREAKARERVLFLLSLAGGLLAAAWGARLHVGGWLNVLLPGWAALALAGALALQARRGRAAVALALLLQVAWLAFDPRSQVPSQADRRAGDELVARIGQIDGSVWIPSSPYLATRAGRPGHAHEMAILDIVRAFPEGSGVTLLAEVDARVRSAAACVLPSQTVLPLQAYAAFPWRAPAVPDGALVPRTGEPIRPEVLAVARP